ncbi:MAG: hypothetical protein E7Z89_03170 [Cyanobacteria bacterium SIG28]|nr:hypothetical protein [Cyanobacteria bacterium SIG28]
MKIQQQNSYNPNLKALYFTKTYPIRTDAYYKDCKSTKLGMKYVEDTSAKLTPIMKEAFQENCFIKNLAEKYDVLVEYLGEKFNLGTFDSSAFIYVVHNEEDLVKLDRYFFSSVDEYTPEGARFRLLSDINGEKYCGKFSYTYGK